jgi:hypothetical protein
LLQASPSQDLAQNHIAQNIKYPERTVFLQPPVSVATEFCRLHLYDFVNSLRKLPNSLQK